MRGDLLQAAMHDALPIATAALIGIVLGMFWYARPAFGGLWTRFTGVTEQQARSFAPRAMAMAGIASCLMALGVWWVVELTGATTAWEGLLVGAVAGATFAGAATGLEVGSTGRPVGLAALNGLFHVTQAALMALLLALWA